MRALATAAGTSPTTVSRIESGAADPTFGTLSRLLEAAGFELEAALHERAPLVALSDLVSAWTVRAGTTEPDWTAFRSMLDLLRQRPDAVPSAIRARPTASGSVVMDALLAGVAEMLADNASIERPSWAARVPRVGEEWSSPATPRMLRAWRASTPPQLAARNLVVAAETLWRPPGLSPSSAA